MTRRLEGAVNQVLRLLVLYGWYILTITVIYSSSIVSGIDVVLLLIILRIDLTFVITFLVRLLRTALVLVLCNFVTIFIYDDLLLLLSVLNLLITDSNIFAKLLMLKIKDFFGLLFGKILVTKIDHLLKVLRHTASD